MSLIKAFTQRFVGIGLENPAGNAGTEQQSGYGGPQGRTASLQPS